jgi:hypothetical protein
LKDNLLMQTHRRKQVKPILQRKASRPSQLQSLRIKATQR